jgi:hypothetical protein
MVAQGRPGKFWEVLGLVKKLPGDHPVVRPEVKDLIPLVANSPKAGPLVIELFLAARAKAALMAALGNQDRRNSYLLEAAQYADYLQAHPERYQEHQPMTIIFELAVFYRDLAAAFPIETAYAGKAAHFRLVTHDWEDCESYLTTLRNSATLARLYSVNDLKELKKKHDLMAPKLEEYFGSQSVAPTNSLLFYFILVWNHFVGDSAWRVEQPKRFIRPGYVFEILAGLSVILLASPSFETVFATVLVASATHVVLWLIALNARNRAAVHHAIKRFVLHVIGFLPYVLFAQFVALHPTSQLGIFFFALAVGAWHSFFDEMLARKLLTYFQEGDLRQGSLNRRIGSILPRRILPDVVQRRLAGSIVGKRHSVNIDINALRLTAKAA